MYPKLPLHPGGAYCSTAAPLHFRQPGAGDNLDSCVYHLAAQKAIQQDVSADVPPHYRMQHTTLFAWLHQYWKRGSEIPIVYVI